MQTRKCPHNQVQLFIVDQIVPKIVCNNNASSQSPQQAMPILHPPQQHTSGSFYHPSSSTKFDNAPFRCSCLAESHTITKYAASPPQLRATLMNTHEANLPNIARPLRWYPSTPYWSRFPQNYGSPQTKQGSVNASNFQPLPQLRNHPPSTCAAKVCSTPPPSKI